MQKAAKKIYGNFKLTMANFALLTADNDDPPLSPGIFTKKRRLRQRKRLKYTKLIYFLFLLLSLRKNSGKSSSTETLEEFTGAAGLG